MGRKIFGKVEGWGQVLGWRVSNLVEKKLWLFLPSEPGSDVCRCLWGKTT